VDVGLSKGCGNGEVQVLEILADGQQIVRLSEGREPQLMDGKQQQQQEAGRAQGQPQAQQALPKAQPQQQQQLQQPGAGSTNSWLPELWRSLWQDPPQAVQPAAQDEGGRRSRVEPTPA
jgi:hypothetical protein